ncbi:hypothetical protein JB92DRAFT_2825082 [Gautieria morchelliformis]|nr:hypothetical protein JB92DRAFT_2825082 [Gautieria morchelliformis]
MTTGNDGDDVVNSEDDEEIESDNAFEESDEDRFAGLSENPILTFSIDHKYLDEHALERQSGQDPDVDADSEELYGNSDEFMDVLDAMLLSFTHTLEEDIDKEVALENFGAIVSKLEPGKKRKAQDEAGEAAVSEHIAPGRKRRMLEERTEAGVESELEDHAGSTKVHPPSHQIQTPDSVDLNAIYRTRPQSMNFSPAQMRDEANMTKTELKLNHLYVEVRVIDTLQGRRQSLDVAKRTGKCDAHGATSGAAEDVGTHVLHGWQGEAGREDQEQTYRKMQRKGREKIKGLIKEAEGLDGVEDGEKERMKPVVCCDLFYPTVLGFLFPQFTLLWSPLYYLAQLPDVMARLRCSPSPGPWLDRGDFYGVIMLPTARD